MKDLLVMVGVVAILILVMNFTCPWWQKKVGMLALVDKHPKVMLNCPEDCKDNCKCEEGCECQNK